MSAEQVSVQETSTRRLARRGLWLLVLSVGAVVLIVAGSRPWFRQSYKTPFGQTLHSSSRGSAADYSSAIGLLFLASVAASFAVRPRSRVFFGGLLTLVAGVSVVVIAFAGAPYLDSVPSGGGRVITHQNAWSYVATIGALLCGAAGLGIAAFGRTWPAMGQKYEGAREAKIAHDPWLALDEGLDPTLEPGPESGE